MKKIFLIISIFFISLNSSFACKIINLGKSIPSNFQENCYKKIGELNPKIQGIDLGNGKKCVGYNIFKVKTNKQIDTFILDNGLNKKIIPFKLYKKSGESLDFSIKNLEGNLDFLKDNNKNTYLIYDEKNTNLPITIEFQNLVKANSFKFIFDYKSTYRKAGIKISQDGKKFYPIDKENISNFDIKYVQIYFYSTVRNITPPEKIKIFELNFISNNFIYIINTVGKVLAYGENACTNNNLDLTNNNGNFKIYKDTKTLTLQLKENKNFNPNILKDSDNDGVKDNIDNCKSIYNPNQKDNNGDGIGNLCADDDKDGIIGIKDNCINIYNPDQKDINRNGIGDKCEFDKDKDGIFDQLDNCINTPNPDQKDDDKDGIGNACDNCELYNPKQLDSNSDGVGDICEEYKKYILEHDKDSDGIIDSKDNCETVANPDQKDSDKDGVGDACDNCKNIQNKDQLDENQNSIGDICEDSDGDGIKGLEDNCINIYNPEQKDSDNDGIGDLCEDEDNDKILAKNDNCPLKYNPDQKDTDKDGIGDICDKNDNRFIESNKNIFVFILVSIAIMFGIIIFRMFKKIK